MKSNNQPFHISKARGESCESDCVISIVVPVYNAENTIERCINSVISQEYPNWELILVDDGSPTICDNYAVSDARIRVIHQVNGGVSSARNLILKTMTGEWVCYGLYRINAKSLYDPLILSEYKKVYTEHIGGDYKTDP